MVLYNEAKYLITVTVFEDDIIVYAKGREKRMAVGFASER